MLTYIRCIICHHVLVVIHTAKWDLLLGGGEGRYMEQPLQRKEIQVVIVAQRVKVWMGERESDRE